MLNLDSLGDIWDPSHGQPDEVGNPTDTRPPERRFLHSGPIAAWWVEYNEELPYGGLGYRTPK